MDGDRVKDRLLQLLTVWSFGVSAPLLKVLSGGGEFFVNHRNSAIEIAAIALGVTIVPPVILSLIESVLGKISENARTAFASLLHLTLLFLGVCGLVNASLSGWTVVAVAVLIAVVGTVALLRVPVAKRATALLSCFALISLLSFFTSTKIIPLISTNHAAIQSLESTSPTPVVLIVFDEFSVNGLMKSDRTIDEIRFPNFARFSQIGYWYREASAINQFTPLALPTIVSGIRPADETKLPIADHYPFNVFTALGKSHQLFVDEPFTDICPEDLCGTGEKKEISKWTVIADLAAVYLSIVVPEEFDLGNPSIDGKWGDFWNPEQDDEDAEQAATPRRTASRARAERARRTIKGWTAGEKPGFYFLHTLIPHMPLEFMPNTKAYSHNTLRAYKNSSWLDAGHIREQSYVRYLMQIGAADTLVGMVEARLRELGIFDKSLIIITADHGISFHVGTYRRGHPSHADFYDDILNIPLFVKFPGQTQGGIIDDNAEVVDILPTILDVVKAKNRPKMDGRSLLSEPPRPVKEVFIGRNPQKKAGRNPEHSIAKVSGPRTYELPIVHRDTTLKWKFSIPGIADPPPSDPFYAGPRSELIGVEISTLTRGPDQSAMSWKLRGSQRTMAEGTYQFTYRPDPNHSPCHLVAEVTGDELKNGELIVVAINGVIRSVSPLIDLEENTGATDTLEVDVIVPELSYRVGTNRIELFLLKQNDTVEKITGSV